MHAKKIFFLGNFYFFTKKNWFSSVFSVTAAWATRSPWSIFLFFFLRLLLLNHFGNLLCAKICFRQYFGITRRYMQKKKILGNFYFFTNKSWFFERFFYFYASVQSRPPGPPAVPGVFFIFFYWYLVCILILNRCWYQYRYTDIEYIGW